MASGDTVCKVCHRPRSLPNPYTRGPHAGKDTLPFVSTTYNVCVSCRSWFCLADVDTSQREVHLTQLQSHEEKRNKHIPDVQAYEHKVNGTPHGRISRSELGTVRTVSAVTSESIPCGTPHGSVLARSSIQGPGPTGDPKLQSLYKGVRGIIRDSEHGCPAGCWKLDHVSSHEFRDTTGLLSSDAALRE